MTVIADRVVVELEAKLDKYNADIAQSDRNFSRHMTNIERTAVSAEKAVTVSAGNMNKSLRSTGYTSRLVAAQFSQVGQQVAVGANAFQALAIQLPDIALALGATGSSAGRLAAFFGGPWGIALTTAAAVAGSLLVPRIFDIGDEADNARPKVDALTEALRALNDERANPQQVGTVEVEVNRLRDRRLTIENILDSENRKGRAGLQERKKLRDELKTVNEQIAGLDRSIKFNEVVQQSRVTPTPTLAPSRSGSRSSSSQVDREAELAKREAERQRELYDSTKARLELENQLALIRAQGTEEASKQADILEATVRISEQFPELASSTRQEDAERLKILQDIATATIDIAYAQRADEEAARTKKRQAEENQRALENAQREAHRVQENQIRGLASLYESAFRGGTQSIWKDFKDIGLKVIAEVLARFTISGIGGGGGSVGDLFSAALGSVLGFAGGGSFQIGGRGGTDRNTLSLNGRPIANVSRGETINVSNSPLSRGGMGTTVVQQTFVLDARYGITTPELIQYVNQTAAQEGQRAYSSAVRDTPVVQARRQRFGS